MREIVTNTIESFYLAIETLMSNKMRSFLTMLGVVIGVFAVITLVAIGEGAKSYVYEQVSKFGTGSRYMELHPGKDQGPSMMTEKLTYRDTEAIEKYCPSVAAVDPRTMGGFDLKYGKKKMTIQFGMGVSYTYPEMFTHGVVMGRFYTKSEQESRKKVAVIGQKVVDKLFSGFNPIGEKMKINGKSFLVIGVFEKKGMTMGFDYDEIVAIPVTTAQKLLDTNRIMEVGIVAKSDDVVYKAKEEVRQLLIKRHKKEDFRLDTMEESLSMINNILGFLTLAIGGIASISLFVGGIGIMNIMLVSVNERIREIGIRKSVGATRRDIFIQFLIESVVISMVGGTVGIILGVAMSMVIMKALGITPVISLWSANLAYFVSIFVGVVSGVYPATRAAQLDPVEALRYE
jgi:putative ABC transport system permease protein